MFQPASHLFPILDQSFTSHPIRPPNPPCFHLSSLFSHLLLSVPLPSHAHQMLRNRSHIKYRPDSHLPFPCRLVSPSLHRTHKHLAFVHLLLVLSTTFMAPPTPAPTSAPLTRPEANKAQRAQTIRRADYDTTCKDIICELTGQFPGIPERVMLENVVRDIHENQRFYITYTTAGMKRQVAGVGFKLGSVVIPPEVDLAEGYIPYPPHYCDSTSLRRLLKPYDTVHTDRFQTSPGGTRIGSYTFWLALHSGQTLPAEIIYNGYTMHVKAKDAPKICSSCKRHGHTVGACRMKKAAMGKKYEACRQYLGELCAATNDDVNMREVPVEGHVTNPRCHTRRHAAAAATW